MDIREAGPQDIAGILAIYNDAVAHSTAVWKVTVVDAANRAAWLADRQRAGYPVLVAVDAQALVLGYASFGDWRASDGYRFTVEHSVYVRGDQHGRGIGRLLMQALIGRARAMGKHVMVGGIEAGNVASICLHESLGFERVGLMRQVGAKFGTWLDLAFLQLVLDDRAVPDRQEGLGGMATAFDIAVDDLTGAETQDLLRLHLAGMAADSPPGHVFALDLSGLRAPGVTVWTARAAGRVAAIAALRVMDDNTGEVKSMRTHPDFLRQGAGAALLGQVIGEARRLGLSRLSLETGSGPAFDPALALYRRRGFVAGPAFGPYEKSAFNQFLHMEL